MKQQQNLKQLQKVKKVEAPAFLLTRIYAKIKARETEQLPASWKWAGALAFSLVLLLNIFSVALKYQGNRNATGIESLSAGLQLSNSNQLYYE